MFLVGSGFLALSSPSSCSSFPSSSARSDESLAPSPTPVPQNVCRESQIRQSSSAGAVDLPMMGKGEDEEEWASFEKGKEGEEGEREAVEWEQWMEWESEPTFESIGGTRGRKGGCCDVAISHGAMSHRVFCQDLLFKCIASYI